MSGKGNKLENRAGKLRGEQMKVHLAQLGKALELSNDEEQGPGQSCGILALPAVGSIFADIRNNCNVNQISTCKNQKEIITQSTFEDLVAISLCSSS